MNDFRLIDGLGMVLNRECCWKLGHLVYCKVDHLKGNKYKVDFFCSKWFERKTNKNIEDIYLVTKELILKGQYFNIKFPTKKELDRIIEKFEGENLHSKCYATKRR